MTEFCAAVDWGTSHFRLWVLDNEGKVLAKRQSDEGLVTAGQIGFSLVLEEHLSKLGLSKSVPAIICGMAGSLQGWQEARYLDTPVELAAIPNGAIVVDNADRDVRILPGICQRDPQYPDVMRGEETLLLGAMTANSGNAIVCMPGTHSKWVTLNNSRVKEFSTHMTGDLFSAISSNTVLRFANVDSKNVDPTASVFLSAIDQAMLNPAEITSQLFAIRSAPLLDQGRDEDASAQLSGVLIGLELAAAISRHGAFEAVTLIAGSPLADLYRAAIDHCNIDIIQMDSEHAARAGLYEAAQQFWSTK
jgi:2-dehydro-3-deoxygalactonokinase